MATVDLIESLTGLGKATRLDVLRRRMAAASGRRDHAPADLPTSARPNGSNPSIGVEPVVDDDPEPPSPLYAANPPDHALISPPFAALLPRRALARRNRHHRHRCSSPCSPPATTSPSSANTA
ncbi:hypothetical protein [Rhodococcus sp. IEGM1428]|uniref:hypothetical protein n=1 Tax=Rhodococcus sp. IEGM1428 TaxID=3392191 RepID=UPI003D0DC211